MYRRVIEAWLDALPLRRQVVHYVRAQGVRAYLVGGTVRDALLGRQSYDLDLAVEGRAMALARQVADRFRAAYVPLDVERDVARVVVRVIGGVHHVDFAGLRAGDIEADLWARDYTINAMAVDLQDPLGELLDPTGGQRDLAAGLLRVVRDDAFREDPLRILRGVRLRGALGFAWTPETEALARAWLHGLGRVSPERIRDELMQILALYDAAGSLAYAHSLGLWSELFPEFAGQSVSLSEQAVRVVASLEKLFGPWTCGQTCTPLLASLQRYRPVLLQRWAEGLSSGRTRWVVLKLAALLSPLPEASAQGGQVARRLRYSVREIHFVETALKASERLLAWGSPTRLEPVDIYRYFRELDEAGVDGALLALAAYHAHRGVEESDKAWAALLEHVEQLLRAWFEQRNTLVEPPQLLSGHDLLQLLEMSPGPDVGRWLQRLREAQVQGLVHTPEEALDYLRAQIKGRSGGSEGRHRPQASSDTGAQS